MRDPKFLPAWHRVDMDALEELAYESHAFIERSEEWGVCTLRIGSETYYAPTPGRAA